MRWIWRSTEVTVLLIVLFIGALLWGLANLDKPALSEPITGLVQDKLGLRLSYRVLRASPLSHIQGEGLMVAQPGPLAGQPPFFELKQLDMQWDPSSMLSQAPRLGRIQVEGLSVTLVENETGASTLALLFPSSPEPTPAPTPTEVTPFSQLLQSFPAGLRVEGIDVRDVQVEQRNIKAGKKVGGWKLRIPRLLLTASPLPTGEASLLFQVLATDENPLEVELVRSTADSAGSTTLTQTLRASLLAEVQLRGTELLLSLDLKRLEQDLVPFPAKPANAPADAPPPILKDAPLVLKSRLTFDPAQQQTRVLVESLRLLGEHLTLQLDGNLLDLPDGAVKPVFNRANLQVNLAGLLPLLGVQEQTLKLKQAQVGIELKELSLNPTSYMPEGGQVLLTGGLTGLDLRPAQVPLTLGSLQTEGSLVLDPQQKGRLVLALPIQQLDYLDPALPISLAKGQLSLELDPLALKLDKWEESSASAQLKLTAQGLRLGLGTQRLDIGQLTQTLKTQYLGKLPEQASLELNTRQTTLTTLTAPAKGVPSLPSPSAPASVPPLKLTLDLPTLQLDTAQPLSSRLTGKLELTAEQHRITVTMERRQAPVNITLDAELTDFGQWQPLLTTYLAGTPLPPLSPLRLTLKGSGQVKGGPLGTTAQEPLRFQQKLSLSLQGLSHRTSEQRLSLPQLTVETQASGTPTDIIGQVVLQVPSLQMQLKSPSEPGKVTPADALVEGDAIAAILKGQYTQAQHNGTLKLDAKRLLYQDDVQPLELKQLSQTLSIQSYQVQNSVAYVLDGVMSLARLQQPYTTAYPPGDLSLKTSMRWVPEVALRVDRFQLTSPQNGTEVELSAAMDLRPSEQTQGLEGVATASSLVEAAPLLEKPELQGVVQIQGGQVLAVQGTVTQALAPLSHRPEELQGLGRVRATLQLESPDQRFIRLITQLQLEHVSLKMPSQQLELEELNGRIDVEEAFRQTSKGWELVLSEQRNLFTRASFPEVQPFLETESYFSAQRVQYQDISFQDLEGNLQIERDQLRLDQLQTTFKEGLLTGQLLLDYAPEETQVLFRGNATQLKLSSARERFDANFALGLSTRKLDLQGQMQIVRVGQQTLIQSLDLLDPYQEDVTYNRIRKGLQVGYPEFVRLRFEYGLMSAHLKLGGAAATLRIDELKGIPVGPLLSSTLSPYLATE